MRAKSLTRFSCLIACVFIFGFGIDQQSGPVLDGRTTNNAVCLRWKDAAAASTDYFVIQKKISGRFYAIDTMMVAAGNNKREFCYRDPFTSAGEYIYSVKRIHQKNEYRSNEKAFISTQQERLILSQNPGSSYITVFHSAAEDVDTLIIVNTFGHRMTTMPIRPKRTFTQLNIGGVPGGIYYVVLNRINTFVCQPLIID